MFATNGNGPTRQTDELRGHVNGIDHVRRWFEALDGARFILWRIYRCCRGGNIFDKCFHKIRDKRNGYGPWLLPAVRP